MPTALDWREIALRLALTVIAGTLIGFNRGERGRPAGLRTTLLVCLAASVAMIQMNLLMRTAGRTSDSFITLDLMHVPAGILSGMGFIGAGAILRRDNLVLMIDHGLGQFGELRTAYFSSYRVLLQMRNTIVQTQRLRKGADPSAAIS